MRKENLQQITVIDNNGSNVMIAAVDDYISNFHCPVRSYLKINTVRDENMIINVSSKKDAIIYDCHSGDILETASNLVIPGVPVSVGSVLGMTLWTIKTKKDEIQTLCQFEVDGEIASSRCLLLNGGNIIPSLYVDYQNSVEMRDNIEFKSNEFEKGKYFSFQTTKLI